MLAPSHCLPKRKPLTQMKGKNDILFTYRCDKMPLFLNPFPITMTFRPSNEVSSVGVLSTGVLGSNCTS